MLSLLKNLSGLGIALAMGMTTDGFLISRIEHRRPYQCFGLGVPFCLSVAVVQRNPGHWGAAEDCFHQAIGTAQRQLSKALELRATTSLARLCKQQDRRDEARRLLSDIYGWLTEGFDTPDLKSAKALLDELNA